LGARGHPRKCCYAALSAIILLVTDPVADFTGGAPTKGDAATNASGTSGDGWAHCQRLTAPSPCGKGRTAERETRPRLLCSEWRRSTIKGRRVLTAHRSNRPATSALLGDAEAGLGIGAGTPDAGDEKEAGCRRWWGSNPRRPATDDTLSVGSPGPFVVRCTAGLAASAGPDGDCCVAVSRSTNLVRMP
jgi:hypothetical protein